MELRELLRDQNGSLSRGQALAVGVSSSAICRLVASGEWEQALPCVLRAVDHPDHPRDRIRRAALWAGDTSTVVGLGAAAWWRLRDEVPDRIHIARPVDLGAKPPPGIAIRRRPIADEDRLRVDGIMVTKRPRTVLDAAVDLGLLDGARLMDRALQEGAVAIESLREVLDRTAGSWGTPLARELLDLAAGGARSEAERRTVRSLKRAGIRDFVVNLDVPLPGWGPAVLDLAFPAQRLVVEIDGWAFHRDVDRFRRDARRQNALVLAGWRVLRVTWYDVRGDAAAVIDSIAQALAAH